MLVILIVWRSGCLVRMVRMMSVDNTCSVWVLVGILCVRFEIIIIFLAGDMEFAIGSDMKSHA